MAEASRYARLAQLIVMASSPNSLLMLGRAMLKLLEAKGVRKEVMHDDEQNDSPDPPHSNNRHHWKPDLADENHCV